jgi:NTP pyrophosphatase (non-canonical NTP hydrolase)
MADRAHFAALEIEADAIRNRTAKNEAQLESAIPLPPKTFALGQAWVTRVSGRDWPDMYDPTPKTRLTTMKTALTFDALRAANVARLPLFKNRRGGPAHSEPDGSDWSLGEWCNAVLGELGEAANLIKKVKRGDMTLDEARVELGNEFADVVTYLDILAYRSGVDLGDVVATKWNEVSERVGVSLRIADFTSLPSQTATLQPDRSCPSLADDRDRLQAALDKAERDYDRLRLQMEQCDDIRDLRAALDKAELERAVLAQLEAMSSETEANWEEWSAWAMRQAQGGEGVNARDTVRSAITEARRLAAVHPIPDSGVTHG